MTAPETIWWFSVMLAISALAVLLLLTCRRYRDELHEQWESARTKEVLLNVFNSMDLMETHADDWTNIHPEFTKHDKPLAIKLILHLCHLIKGSERDSLTRLLVQLGARDQARRDLKHHALIKRLEAIQVLQLFNDRESIAMLVATLDDKEAEVVISAADALHELHALPAATVLAPKLEARGLLNTHDTRNLFRDIARNKPASLVTLAKQTDVSNGIKQVLADALGHALDYSVIEGLAQLATDPLPSIRRQALESLGTLEHPGAESLVRTALGDDNWLVRLEAIKSAGRIGLNRTAETIVGFLDEDNWYLRFQAARTLTQLGDVGLEILLERSRLDDRGGRMAALMLGEKGIDLPFGPEGPVHA